MLNKHCSLREKKNSPHGLKWKFFPQVIKLSKRIKVFLRVWSSIFIHIHIYPEKYIYLLPFICDVDSRTLQNKRKFEEFPALIEREDILCSHPSLWSVTLIFKTAVRIRRKHQVLRATHVYKRDLYSLTQRYFHFSSVPF